MHALSFSIMSVIWDEEVYACIVFNCLLCVVFILRCCGWHSCEYDECRVLGCSVGCKFLYWHALPFIGNWSQCMVCVSHLCIC